MKADSAVLREAPAWGNRALLWLAVLLLVGITAAVLVEVRKQAHEQARGQMAETLSTVSTIKLADLRHWLHDLQTKNALPVGNVLGRALAAADTAPGQLQAPDAHERLRWLVERSDEFRTGWLLDLSGQPVLSLDEVPPPQLPDTLLAEAAAQPLPQLGDFYLNPQGLPSLATVTAVRTWQAGQAVLVGYMVIEIEPAADLFPMLDSGLSEGRALRVWLMRREGESVRFLGSSGPLEAPGHFSLMTVQGQDVLAMKPPEMAGQVLEAEDVTGEPAIGVVQRLQGRDWLLVTSIPLAVVEAEAQAAFVRVAASVVVLVVLLAGLLGALMGVFRLRRNLQAVSVDLQRVRRESLLDFFIRYANDVVLLMDEAGTILECNDAACTTYGHSREQLIGANVRMLRAPETLKDVARQLSDASTPLGLTFKTLHQRADGSRFAVEVSSGTFEHEGRRYRQSIIRDISQREADAIALARSEAQLREALDQQIELNRKLAAAHSQLLQSEKMASIGQLAAGVAHEINNPVGFVNSNLGTLRTYVEALLTLVETAREQLQAGDHADAFEAQLIAHDFAFIREDAPALLNESLEGLMRVRKIVQDLKDFSRVGENDWQWANLHAGLDSTLNIVWNEIKYKARVDKQYGTLPEVMCLPSQLNQVFMNLLVNAAQAIDSQGVITLRTGTLPESDDVWVEVEDNGCGIDEALVPRLFDPFFTTKPVGAGTGLGLSLAFSIVRKHEGHIEVRSQPGKGSCFRLVLPRCPAERMREAGQPAMPRPADQEVAS